MLGNDVIDLADPETRERHPRFDARVFTPEEALALARAAEPERLRWRLWAAKEAAYKCLKKLEPSAVFSPRRFAVRLESDCEGSVVHAGRRLRVALLEHGDALVAVASDGEDPARAARSLLGVLPRDAAPERASAAARALARAAAANQLGCAASELAIARHGRAPRLERAGTPLGLDLSLAHHGRFVAAAIETSPGSSAP